MRLASALCVAVLLASQARAADDTEKSTTVLPFNGATLKFGPEGKSAAFGVTAGSKGFQISAKLSGPLDDDTRRTLLEGDSASFVANISVDYNDDYQEIDTAKANLGTACHAYHITECSAAALCKAMGSPSGCSEEEMNAVFTDPQQSSDALRSACARLNIPSRACTASQVATRAQEIGELDVARRFGLPLKRGFSSSVGANLRLSYDRVSAYRGDVGPTAPDSFDKATEELDLLWRGYWSTAAILTVRPGFEHSQGAKVKKAQRCEGLTSSASGVTGQSCTDVLVTTAGYKKDWASSILAAFTYVLPSLRAGGDGYSPAFEVSANFKRIGLSDASLDPTVLAFVAGTGNALQARTGVGVSFSIPFRGDSASGVAAGSVQDFSAFAFLGADFDAR